MYINVRKSKYRLFLCSTRSDFNYNI